MKLTTAKVRNRHDHCPTNIGDFYERANNAGSNSDTIHNTDCNNGQQGQQVAHFY